MNKHYKVPNDNSLKREDKYKVPEEKKTWCCAACGHTMIGTKEDLIKQGLEQGHDCHCHDALVAREPSVLCCTFCQSPPLEESNSRHRQHDKPASCNHTEVDYNCPCFYEGFETADAENGYNAKEMVLAERERILGILLEKGHGGGNWRRLLVQLKEDSFVTSRKK